MTCQLDCDGTDFWSYVGKGAAVDQGGRILGIEIQGGQAEKVRARRVDESCAGIEVSGGRGTMSL
eukprot:624082-Hanusia_phi.AAC.4